MMPPIELEPSKVQAEVENNKTRQTAQLVSPNPALVNGTLSSTSDTDYYRVTLAGGKTLTATLTGPAGANYNLYLYNANGTLVASSTQGTGAVETATFANTGSAAATVYARVVYASGGTGSVNGKYTLKLAQ